MTDRLIIICILQSLLFITVCNDCIQFSGSTLLSTLLYNKSFDSWLSKTWHLLNCGQTIDPLIKSWSCLHSGSITKLFISVYDPMSFNVPSDTIASYLRKNSRFYCMFLIHTFHLFFYRLYGFTSIKCSTSKGILFFFVLPTIRRTLKLSSKKLNWMNRKSAKNL